jgi:hypothetical protein
MILCNDCDNTAIFKADRDYLLASYCDDCIPTKGVEVATGNVYCSNDCCSEWATIVYRRLDCSTGGIAYCKECDDDDSDIYEDIEPYSIFNVPLETRQKFNLFIKEKLINNKNSCIDKDIYDKHTTRYIIEDIKVIDKIKSVLTNTSIDVDLYVKSITIHYINYNIDGPYRISRHSDNCDKTVIIYLDKSESVKDTFIVENSNVNMSKCWEDGGLYFSGNAVHSGMISGSGYREIICIFIS